MDIQDRSPQQEPSDEQVNPNLVITITMKKMDSGAGSSAWEQAASNDKHNNNNNDGSVKIVKKESAAKEFCKNLFNKSSSSSSNGDKNNNSQPAPVTNQYTKVTVDGLMSQLTFHQNRQMSQLAQHGNAIAVNQIDTSMRWVIYCFRRIVDNESNANNARLTSLHLCCSAWLLSLKNSVN